MDLRLDKPDGLSRRISPSRLKSVQIDRTTLLPQDDMIEIQRWRYNNAQVQVGWRRVCECCNGIPPNFRFSCVCVRIRATSKLGACTRTHARMPREIRRLIGSNATFVSSTDEAVPQVPIICRWCVNFEAGIVREKASRGSAGVQWRAFVCFFFLVLL